MKDLLKTIIVVSLSIIIIVVAYFISGNIKHGVELFTRATISESDPTIGILMERVESINHLRRAKLVNTDLTSEEIIRFTLDNMTESDYSTMNVEPYKIVCYVSDRVTFNSQYTCNLKVIDNSVFMDYQKKYFNTETALQYDEIKYHGYYCKNDGFKYYCLSSNYVNNILDYSVFDHAYEVKDKTYLRGYYLRVDVSDNAKCLEYFNANYCSNYTTMTKPTLSKSTITENGVLYEHVFKKNDVSYYLESSYIVSEE